MQPSSDSSVLWQRRGWRACLTCRRAQSMPSAVSRLARRSDAETKANEPKGVAYGILETARHASGTIAVATLATIAAAASYEASFLVTAVTAIASPSCRR